MLQRIQSIFLLLASGSAFSLFASPMSLFNLNKTEALASSTALSDGIFNIQDNSVLLALAAACGLIALVAIFVFKNRSLQVSLSRLIIFAAIAFAGLSYYFFIQNLGEIKAVYDLGIGTFIPLSIAVFAFLAIRFIKKDDKLVKSMDRLR